MNEELKKEIQAVKRLLVERIDEVDDKRSVLRSSELKALYDRIRTIDEASRSAYGKAVNDLKNELTNLVNNAGPQQTESRPPIDITAPFAINAPKNKQPGLLPVQFGSEHPLMAELDAVLGIFASMGFSVVESREIDDDWHMFTSLNFPEGHPARDDYDTFMTVQKDEDNKPYIAPAHTSTMQNRAMRQYIKNLDEGQPIAVVIPGRVFRNEDVDARHEHTFYQLEGVYVAKNVSIGHFNAAHKAHAKMVTTVKSF